jgi:hypothetical protein
MQPTTRKRRRWILWLVVIVAIFLLISLVNGIRTGGRGIDATAVTPTNTATVPVHVTPTATKPPQATHGRPRMGGDITDFYGKYGTPSTVSNGSNVVWFTPDRILISATPNIINTVVGVTIVGLESWNETKTLAYCQSFLPDDAQEFNRLNGTPTWIDYHSSMGEIVLQLASQNCVITVASS